MKKFTIRLLAIALLSLPVVGCVEYIKADQKTIASKNTALGGIQMMTPQEAIDWGRTNATNPAARLYVYRNLKLKTYAEMYQWFKAVNPTITPLKTLRRK